MLAILLLRVVDYAELRDVVSGIRLPWALAALAMVQFAILLRTLRWIEIHEAFGLPRARLAYQMRLSYAVNLATLVLPQIINPFSRFILMLQDGYRARRVAAASILEKALQLAVAIAFGLYGALFLASTFGDLVWWAVGLALGALGASVAIYLERSRLIRLAAALLARVPGLGEPTEGDRAETAENIVSLHRRVLARLCGWSLLIALTQATMLYFLSRSLGVGLSYPFMVATWGIVALSTLLPISIAGVGTREAILVVAFRGADRSTDAAVALGLLVLVVVAFGSAPGAVEWLRRSLGSTRDGSDRTVRGVSATEAPPDMVLPQDRI